MPTEKEDRKQTLQDTLQAVSTMNAAELTEIAFQAMEMVRDGRLTPREANAVTRAAKARRKALQS